MHSQQLNHVLLQGESTWQLQPVTDARTDARTLTLTIWDNEEQTFTIEQASQMPLPDFGRIWQVCPPVSHKRNHGLSPFLYETMTMHGLSMPALSCFACCQQRHHTVSLG